MLDFHAIASFIISPTFIWIWCSLIVVYAFKWLVTLHWESLKIRSQLKEAIKLITSQQNPQEFIRVFPEISSKILQLPILRQAWQDFYEGLAYEKGKVAGEACTVVKSFRETSDFFNESNLVHPGIDGHFYATIPTHLSGLGILGTFCGLASGIFLAKSGLAGGNMQELQFSLAQLLSGASLAFWTSIAGILGSIIFTRLEKLAMSQVKNLIHLFNFYLHRKVQVASVEKIAEQQLQHVHEQNESMKKLTRTFENWTRDQVALNRNVIKGLVGEFRNLLSEGASQEIKLTAQAFKQVFQAADATKTMLVDSQKSLEKTQNSQSALLQKSLDALTSKFQEELIDTTDLLSLSLQDSMKKITDEVRVSLREAGQELQKPIQTLNQTALQMEKDINKTLAQWGKALDGSEQLSESIALSHREMQNGVLKISQSLSEFNELYKKTESNAEIQAHAAHKVSTSIQQLHDFNQELKKNWNDYCSRFEGVDASLRNVFQQTTDSLTNYTHKFRDMTKDLDRHMSKGMLTLAGAVGDLNQVVGNIPEAIKNAKTPH